MFTDNQLRVLAVLISRPDEERHLSALGQLIGKKAGVFQRGVNSLERQGIILSRRRGNQRLFRVNASHPLFPEIKGIVRKTHGAEGRLRKAVKNVASVKLALIYGSYAADRMRADSDIDLLVVADTQAEEALAGEIDIIGRELGREINYRIYSEEEFARRLKDGNPFLKEVLSSKHILLKGGL